MLFLSKAGGSRISPLYTFCISVVGLPSIFLKNLCRQSEISPPHLGSTGYLATTAWMSSISGWSSAESWIELRMWARPFTFGLSDAKWTSSSEGHQNCTYVKLHVPIPNERLEWAGDTQVERGSDVKVGIMLLADLRCVPELPLYCTMSWGHPTQWILQSQN